VVLLPVVTLGSLTNLYRAAMVVMMAGANFIAVRSHPSCMPPIVPCLHGRFHATSSHTAPASHLHELSCRVATGSARLNEMSARLSFQHYPQAPSSTAHHLLPKYHLSPLPAVLALTLASLRSCVRAVTTTHCSLFSAA